MVLSSGQMKVPREKQLSYLYISDDNLFSSRLRRSCQCTISLNAVGVRTVQRLKTTGMNSLFQYNPVTLKTDPSIFENVKLHTRLNLKGRVSTHGGSIYSEFGR